MEKHFKQEGPPIGGAVQNAMSLIPQRLLHIAYICYHFFRKRSCITLDRDNNMTPAIYVIYRSRMRLEYNHCNEK